MAARASATDCVVSTLHRSSESIKVNIKQTTWSSSTARILILGDKEESDIVENITIIIHWLQRTAFLFLDGHPSASTHFPSGGPGAGPIGPPYRRSRIGWPSRSLDSSIRLPPWQNLLLDVQN